ncbi:MAG: hypothetical protein II273_04755 [Lachnospiraceae bacterium]|nr:hypothetical protein [Lachnospiraceae bacterium]
MMLTRSCQKPKIEIINKVGDTVIIERIDTFTVIKPVPYKVTDTVYIYDTINNTINGNIFVQQIKEYKDSTYYAKISGINAYLEEIRVYPKTITQYINTKEYVYVPPKKWSVGIQGGIGITPKGLQPYLGVGVSRRLEF